MKAVVISHTYITKLNRRKLQALSRLDRSMQIAVIVPQTWVPGGVQSNIVISATEVDDGVQVIAMPSFSRENQGMMSFGTELLRFLHSFKPEIIQVEQGAKSLAYAQSITLNKLLGLKAKNVFFTWWNLPYRNNFAVRTLERYNLRNTHGLICGNADGLDILRAHGYSGPAIISPQLGVDETLFKPDDSETVRAELDFQKNDFVVGFAGRLVPEKGVLTLLKAFQYLVDKAPAAKSLKLLLVGRGPLKDEIQKIAHSSNLQVKIQENVPHDEMPRYLRAMDVMVLPSQFMDQQSTLTAKGWKEQFGHVLIEAMACATPVIGSDSGEIPKVIMDAGLIFEAENSRALSAAIERIMTETGLARTLAEAGRARALQQYTDGVLAQKLYDFWNSLCNNP